MQITQAVLDALRTDFELRYMEAYKGTPTWYQTICTEIQSKTKSNTYGWMANSPVLRQWIGPRVAQNLSEHAYVLPNVKYEGTIELERTAIDDDELGVFTGQAIPGLAEASRKHPDTLLASVLSSNPNGYDGVSFFNSAHPAFGAMPAYSNDFAISSGGVLTGATVNTMFANMAGYLGENGLPLAVRPTIIMGPPQRQYEIMTILQSATYALPNQATTAAATVDNVLRGWAQPLIVPELAGSPNVVYFIDASKSIKPFVYQVRDAPQFVTRQDPQDPKVFDLDVFTYGVRQRDAMGLSLPFLASRLTIS